MHVLMQEVQLSFDSKAVLLQELERANLPPLSGVRTRPLRELPPLISCPRRNSTGESAMPTDCMKACQCESRMQSNAHRSLLQACRHGMHVPQGGFHAAGEEPAARR